VSNDTNTQYLSEMYGNAGYRVAIIGAEKELYTFESGDSTWNLRLDLATEKTGKHVSRSFRGYPGPDDKAVRPDSAVAQLERVMRGFGVPISKVSTAASLHDRLVEDIRASYVGHVVRIADFQDFTPLHPITGAVLKKWDRENQRQLDEPKVIKRITLPTEHAGTISADQLHLLLTAPATPEMEGEGAEAVDAASSFRELIHGMRAEEIPALYDRFASLPFAEQIRDGSILTQMQGIQVVGGIVQAA
jgi:hypothetical protein